MQVPWKIAVQLGLLHQTWLGQQLARTSLLRWYFRSSSAKLGRTYDAPASARLIPRFIQVYFSKLPAIFHAACTWANKAAAQHVCRSCSGPPACSCDR